MKTTVVRPVPVVPALQVKPGISKPSTVLLFSVGEQTYALPLRELQEIVPLAQLSRPPALPSFVAGFLNLRGTAIPVVRLDRLFGVPDLSPGLYTPLLLLRHPDYRIALVAGKLERIVTVAADGILPLPANQSFNECAEGMLTLDGRIILLLSAERILLEKEHQWLAEFQDSEQRRLREWEGAMP